MHSSWKTVIWALVCAGHCHAIPCRTLLCCAVLLRVTAALGGPLPSSITNLTKLEVLSLESNELSGTLPPNMCSDMTALRVRP